MWILKNSKELLDHLKSPNFNLITNIKSFDFSTLYTTIPHQKLKSRLATIIRNSFLHKNGNRRYKYLVLGREGPYFVKEHSDAKNKYTEEDIIKMLEFLVDNIFVVFAGNVFQQIVGIPMGTNCAPLLADIFLYSYEAEFIQSLFSAGKKRLASQFNFTYRYIDDVLSINNPDFENYLGQMYPPELEIKDTTESNTSASYLDLLLSIGRDGQLRTFLYDKRDDFNFHITNFPFLSSNIPSSPAYGVFISQLIRYARACSSYERFILRAMRLSNKLLGQGYVKERLKSSLRKFYGRYGDLTKQYEVPLSRMLHDILDDDHIQWHPPLIGHYTNFWPLLIWSCWVELNWLFNVTINDISVIYVTAHRCAGGLKKKLDLRSGSQRHRHFVGFFNVPVLDLITEFDLIVQGYFYIVTRGILCQTSRNPPWGPGGLSRECAPPYPQRDRKRRVNGAVCRNHRIKRLVPCRC